MAGIYGNSRLRGLAERCTRIAVINGGGILVFVFILYLMHLDDYSRVVLGHVLRPGHGGCWCLKRLVRRWYDRARRRRGLGLRHILLVGGGKSAALYLRALEHNPYYGFVVDGYLAPMEEPGLGVPYLGDYARLDTCLESPAIDEGWWWRWKRRRSRCCRAPLPPATSTAPASPWCLFTAIICPPGPPSTCWTSASSSTCGQTPFDNLLNAALKRGLDIVGSLILIVLTSPVMLATAIGVKLSSPGPVIFKQERIGLNKRPFMMYKFRSMRVNAKEETGWSTERDPRKTRFGSLIRKFSLDELPQFFNVLKGDMSLVGPRPEVPYHVEHFKEEIPRYLVRQQVRPGCTGWAQIHGLRGDTDIAERIRYDIWYIENWTVALDIKIIFRTVFGGKMINNEKLQ